MVAVTITRRLREFYHKRTTYAFLSVAILITATMGQKVKVGYDASSDFSKYKTYVWAEPALPPSQPALYSIVVESIDTELSSKGLQKVAKDGDLTLMGAGGVEYGNNTTGGAPIVTTFSGLPPGMNATMWTGAEGPAALMASYVPQGTLALEFVDRRANKVIWTGTVSQKLEIGHNNKSLDLLKKSIIKLLRQYPPKNR